MLSSPAAVSRTVAPPFTSPARAITGRAITQCHPRRGGSLKSDPPENNPLVVDPALDHPAALNYPARIQPRCRTVCWRRLSSSSGHGGAFALREAGRLSLSSFARHLERYLAECWAAAAPAAPGPGRRTDRENPRVPALARRVGSSSRRVSRPSSTRRREANGSSWRMRCSSTWPGSTARTFMPGPRGVNGTVGRSGSPIGPSNEALAVVHGSTSR